MMDHPFINDAQEKSVEELLEIIGGLNKKLMIANRMHNPALFNQLLMSINTYRSVLQQKQQEEWNKGTGDNSTGHIDIQ